jgi:hypothetical protein
MNCNRRHRPPQTLQHYIEMVGEFADSVGVATPLLDRTAELFDRFVAMGLADCDGAAIIDVIGSLPREKLEKPIPQRGTCADNKGESS